MDTQEVQRQTYRAEIVLTLGEKRGLLRCLSEGDSAGYPDLPGGRTDSYGNTVFSIGKGGSFGNGLRAEMRLYYRPGSLPVLAVLAVPEKGNGNLFRQIYAGGNLRDSYACSDVGRIFAAEICAAEEN